MTDKIKKKIPSIRNQIAILLSVASLVIVSKPLMVDYMIGTSGNGIVREYWPLLVSGLNIISFVATYLILRKFGIEPIKRAMLSSVLILIPLRTYWLYSSTNIMAVLAMFMVEMLVLILLKLQKKIHFADLINNKMSIKLAIWIYCIALMIAWYQTDWILLTTERL